MPVVRMRRTTRRVFGARILRSGRRVMTSSPRETNDRIKPFEPAKAAGPGAKWTIEKDGNETPNPKDTIFNESENGNSINNGDEKKYGIVYGRKRKRGDEDRMFGKVYVRKRRFQNRVFTVLVDSLSCDGNDVMSRFLGLVFRYMMRVELSLSELSVFVMSEGFARVYSTRGLRFLRDSSRNKRSGVCKIFGASSFVPSFMVDFSALPSCFMYMHMSLFLRFKCLPAFFLINRQNPIDIEIVRDDNIILDEEMVEAIHQEPCISTPSEAYLQEIQNTPSVNTNTGKKSSLKITIGAPRTNVRSVRFKSGVITGSIQKRRSSLRSQRAKCSYPLRGRMANGTLLSSLLSSKHDSFYTPPSKPNLQLTFTRSDTSNTSTNSSLVESSKDIGSSSCSGNILVVESTKCYRIVEAVIKLEKNEKTWYVAAKKDGKTLYSLNTRNIMRPCSFNRVTHGVIWREEDCNWKLEFPDRDDWLIFKDLYKECSERNMKALPANLIPVPGVQEVSDYAESNKATFCRPSAYISVKDGELSRALAKETSNYDMDSEDEEWLQKFNDDSSLRIEQWDRVSEDNFEMIIDALEKSIFLNADDYSDEKAAVNSCLHLERKEVVEPVYSYWMRKRKQKRSALVQVFQFYQPRRTQLLSKPFIRKKRSFKRQPSRPERLKQQTFISFVAPEPDPVEEQKALLKVEEAKAATARYVTAAVEKRNKAQLLMEKADMATYKAAMALRIAEAAQISELFDVSDTFLLE